jgi:hypothetical protein
MRRLAESMLAPRGELVGQRSAPYMRRVRPQNREGRAEADGGRQNRADSMGRARGESIE